MLLFLNLIKVSQIFPKSSKQYDKLFIKFIWKWKGTRHVQIFLKKATCGKTWFTRCSVQFSSVAQSCPTLRPHESQHTRPPCPSPTPRVYPNSCPSSWWSHPAISSSVIPFSSSLQSFPTSGSFQMNQFFKPGSQGIGVSASASFLLMNIQDWFPLE